MIQNDIPIQRFRRCLISMARRWPGPDGYQLYNSHYPPDMPCYCHSGHISFKLGLSVTLWRFLIQSKLQKELEAVLWQYLSILWPSLIGLLWHLHGKVNPKLVWLIISIHIILLWTFPRETLLLKKSSDGQEFYFRS